MGKVAAWLLGILTGVIVTVGGEAAAIAFIPSKTYLNATGTTIVGDKIGNQGLFGVISSINDYVIDDIPIIKTTLDQLASSGGLGDYVAIDYEAIKDIHLTDAQLSNKLSAAIKVIATLESLKIDLGNFGKLSIFKEWTPVTPTAAEVNENYKAYYYKDGEKYVRAYDDAKNRLAPEGAQLYLPNLSQVVVTEMFTALSARLGDITYPEFMKNLMGMSDAELADDSIYKIVGDKKLKDLKSLDIASVKLTSVIEKKDANAALWDLLIDIVPTATKAEDITIGDLSDLDIKKGRLVSVLKYAGNESLYNVLCDMTGKNHSQYGTLLIGDLQNADMNAVKLNTLLNNSSDNRIIAKLLERNSTVGTLAHDINALSTHELFGSNCFTANIADAAVGRDGDKYKLVGDSYVYDPSASAAETRYISKNAGIWLIFAYDAKDIYATNGRANTFAPSTTTFQELQDNPSSFSNKVGDAYIYQLISAGIVSGAFGDAVTSKTLNQILTAI